MSPSGWPPSPRDPLPPTDADISDLWTRSATLSEHFRSHLPADGADGPHPRAPVTLTSLERSLRSVNLAAISMHSMNTGFEPTLSLLGAIRAVVSLNRDYIAVVDAVESGTILAEEENGRRFPDRRPHFQAIIRLLRSPLRPPRRDEDLGHIDDQIRAELRWQVQAYGAALSEQTLRHEEEMGGRMSQAENDIATLEARVDRGEDNCAVFRVIGLQSARKKTRMEAEEQKKGFEAGLAAIREEADKQKLEFQAALAASRQEADQQRARLDAQFLVIKDMADSLQRQQDALAAKAPRSRVEKPSEAAPTWRRSVGSAPAASGTAEVAAVEPTAETADGDVIGRRSVKVEMDLREKIKALEQELAAVRVAPPTLPRDLPAPPAPFPDPSTIAKEPDAASSVFCPSPAPLRQPHPYPAFAHNHLRPHLGYPPYGPVRAALDRSSNSRGEQAP
ncbi:uncharacterized protein MKK02DRAFT_43379 [Dioszegia hungarica]|uniref:Uncharacterized protein n=1 Tax=Dioszegia hungarica TaxID=4972 RepID=A0AA38HA86_9TREE|nr:uncharacterized protein MKK02DRAFT_43379 [Dioszegia hungarica]KAI9637457.1 hypothetical protein MKK02DRAFT_43379 [Dioszegia hungarica]